MYLFVGAALPVSAKVVKLSADAGFTVFDLTQYGTHCTALLAWDSIAYSPANFGKRTRLSDFSALPAFWLSGGPGRFT